MSPRGGGTVRGRFEGFVVSLRAVDVIPRRRICVVQGEPFPGLLKAVVEEFVVQLAGPKRDQQVAPNVFGKLAGMYGHIDEGPHGPFLTENSSQDKSALRPHRPLT